MTKPDDPELVLERFFPYVVNRLAETISAELSTIYTREYGLSISQWRVIANLAQHNTLKAQEIVNFTAMEKSMISRAVNALAQRKLIVTKQSDGDNRAKILSLSKAGRTLYESIAPNVLGWEKELLSTLSEKEYQNLMGLLEKLKMKLENCGAVQ